MKFMRLASRLLTAALAIQASFAFGQAYPSSNPTFIPNAIVSETTLTAPGTVSMNLNNIGTVEMRVAGTYTGLAATMQVTESRGSSPAFTTISCTAVGGTQTASITGNGLYRCNTAGAAAARLNVTAISTGSVVVSMSGSPATGLAISVPLHRATYSAATASLTPASSATDFFTLTGSASTTVTVHRVACNGIATAAGVDTIVGLVRSTANTGGTSTSLTAVPNDSNNAAATAVARSYTANPTTGTAVGNVFALPIALNTAASSAFDSRGILAEFGNKPYQQPITLRGVTQVFALNNGGSSFPSGTALSCFVEWSEE